MNIEVHVVFRRGDNPPGWEFGVYDLDTDRADWKRGGLSRAEALNYAQRVAQSLAAKNGKAVSVHVDRPEQGIRLNGPGTSKTLEVIICADGVAYTKPR